MPLATNLLGGCGGAPSAATLNATLRVTYTTCVRTEANAVEEGAIPVDGNARVDDSDARTRKWGHLEACLADEDCLEPRESKSANVPAAKTGVGVRAGPSEVVSDWVALD
jgi:hypothetical protein